MKQILKRIKLPTPQFFIKLRSWIMWLGGGLSGMSATLLSQFPDSKLLMIASTAGIVFTAVGTLISSLPVDWDQVDKPQSL